MDGQDQSQPTQATQTILDPRRIGKQNSGFSDDDISDIICVLSPLSFAARQEVQRLANEDSPYIIGRDEAETVEIDYGAEDEASRFQSNLGNSSGNNAILLRLSSNIKDPRVGFAFGRNAQRCDILFVNDPRRRVSNVHFRIYVNEYGSVMIEDQSTNGTFVDRQLLTRAGRAENGHGARVLLSSGSTIRILLHSENDDLMFRVRIPRRDVVYERAYVSKVEDFFARHSLQGPDETIRAGPGGHVDLFPRPPRAQAIAQAAEGAANAHAQTRTPNKRREANNMPRREWADASEYNKVTMIGKGAFAVVYKVTAKFDGLPYAAKELEKRRFIKDGVIDQKVENEMRIMQRIKHPNIVRYIDSFDWEDRLLVIIMDFVPHGDLGRQIQEEGPFSEDVTQMISKQLLSALGYLHKCNITHRDVKPDNILINSLDPIDVKLTDFGLSKMVDTEQTFLRTFCGTLLYCAPEVYNEYAEYDENGTRNRGQRVRRMPGQRYSHAVDIWSLGGVLFYTMTGSPPYPVKSGISPTELLHMVMTTKLNTTPLRKHEISYFGIDFISRMLQRRPEHRATVVELEEHAWVGGASLAGIPSSQSYDEITDDEDLILPGTQPKAMEEDRISDSEGEDSGKENSNYRGQRIYGQPPQGQPRLFGEVGSSAIGSSGAIPEDFLNLPARDIGSAQTEIMDSQSNGLSDISEDRQRWPQEWDTNGSVLRRQSPDQLQSLVENVASQSLGTREHALPEVQHPSLVASVSDFQTSKRKPASPESSGDFDDPKLSAKPTMKRLKSDVDMPDLASDVIEEFNLLARMPPVKRLGSGRQVDKPVTKMSFWEEDRSTWHLRYPEMTQLQYDAFFQAAKDMGKEFSPGDSPLWALAMKYFPPSHRPSLAVSMSRPRVDMRRTEMNIDELPSTAMPMDVDMLDVEEVEAQIVVPLNKEDQCAQPAGMIESTPGSCIQGVSIPIADSFISFGRELDNTHIFKDSQDRKVPKYAFKILLYSDANEDLSRDPNRYPWQRNDVANPSAYSFWISTKASLGIRVNGFVLPSSNSKEPAGPSKHWTRLHEGDKIQIWGRPNDGQQTMFTFHCSWGGSSAPRDPSSPIALAEGELNKYLDYACTRVEKRIEKKRKSYQATMEHQERMANVDRERERSRIFEEKRLEAVTWLQTKVGKESLARSRRASPGGRALPTRIP